MPWNLPSKAPYDRFDSRLINLQLGETLRVAKTESPPDHWFSRHARKWRKWVPNFKISITRISNGDMVIVRVG